LCEESHVIGERKNSNKNSEFEISEKKLESESQKTESAHWHLFSDSVSDQETRRESWTASDENILEA
jgi:hypothetical protein